MKKVNFLYKDENEIETASAKAERKKKRKAQKLKRASVMEKLVAEEDHK